MVVTTGHRLWKGSMQGLHMLEWQQWNTICTGSWGPICVVLPQNLLLIYHNNFLSHQQYIISDLSFPGIGAGMAYTTGLVAVGQYFDRNRPIAFAVATSAGGIANMCFPWVSTYLLERVGWRGALMITSGLVGNVCVAAMVLRPVQQYEKTQGSDIKKVPLNEDNSSSFLHQTERLLNSKAFLLLCFNTFLLLFSASVVFTHIAAYAKSEGLSPYWCSLLITLVGGASLCKSELLIIPV